MNEPMLSGKMQTENYDTQLGLSTLHKNYGPKFEAPLNRKGHPQFKNSIGMQMVLVPNGTYFNGFNHVRITRPFYMAKTPITNQQFGDLNLQLFDEDFKYLPIDANKPYLCPGIDRELLVKLTFQEELLLNGWVYTLPTSAQWELACRAGSNRRDFYGPIDDICWFADNSGGQLQEVGLKQSNAYGLHDMHGNVWELCSDGRRNRTYLEEIDPVGSTHGYKIIRGGNFESSAMLCSAIGLDIDNVDEFDGVGIRPILVYEGE